MDQIVAWKSKSEKEKQELLQDLDQINSELSQFKSKNKQNSELKNSQILGLESDYKKLVQENADLKNRFAQLSQQINDNATLIDQLESCKNKLSPAAQSKVDMQISELATHFAKQKTGVQEENQQLRDQYKLLQAKNESLLKQLDNNKVYLEERQKALLQI